MYVNSCQPASRPACIRLSVYIYVDGCMALIGQILYLHVCSSYCMVCDIHPIRAKDGWIMNSFFLIFNFFHLDTESVYSSCTNSILARYNKTFPPEVKKRMMGRPRHESAQVLIDALQLPMTAEELVDELYVLLFQKFPEAKLLPGNTGMSSGNHCPLVYPNEKLMCKCICLIIRHNYFVKMAWPSATWPHK